MVKNIWLGNITYNKDLLINNKEELYKIILDTPQIGDIKNESTGIVWTYYINEPFIKLSKYNNENHLLLDCNESYELYDNFEICPDRSNTKILIYGNSKKINGFLK